MLPSLPVDRMQAGSWHQASRLRCVGRPPAPHLRAQRQRLHTTTNQPQQQQQQQQRRRQQHCTAAAAASPMGSAAMCCCEVRALLHSRPAARRRIPTAAAAAGDVGSTGRAQPPPLQQLQQQQPWGQQQQQGPPPGPPAPAPAPLIDPAAMPSDGLAGIFMAYALQLQEAMQQQQAAAAPPGPTPGANLVVRDLGFHPPGAERPLLDGVSFHLRPNQLGLVIGRSGSGKTTLLQLLAGLSEQTAGGVFVHRPVPGDHASGLLTPTHIEERMRQVGLVFQFPERHFLGDDVMQEMSFTWPRDVSYWGQRQAMAVRMQRVINAVGLSDIPFNIPPSALSGGQQRRLALALQLVRAPSLLLLDEPLAGLDWHARREVVALLAELKKEATLLVVSHDLADIAPLVDCAWRMQMGGKMEPVEWPPDSLSDMED